MKAEVGPRGKPTSAHAKEGHGVMVLSGPPSRPKEGKERRKGWAGSAVALERGRREFFKNKSFSISLALKIDQIQINLNSTSNNIALHTTKIVCFGMNATNIFLNLIVNSN